MTKFGYIFGPRKIESVRFSKYISKGLLVRLALLFAMIAAAALFDFYHTSPGRKTVANHQANEPESGKICFFSQANSNNLKVSGTDFVARSRFVCTENRFLLKHHNLRAFQIMKAETVSVCFSAEQSFHSLPYRRVLYMSPDDTPPVS